MQTVQAPAFPEGTAWVRAVMASTLDGAMRGPDGGSRAISSPADQRWFAALRQQPDVLLVGASTIRAEDYRPSRKTIAVVSGSLDLPASLRMLADRTDEHPRPIVLTSAESAARAPGHLRRLADVVACGDRTVDLVRARAELLDRGLTRIQCEGGPRLLSGLVEADLLDELLLTITPRLLGGGPSEHIVHVPGGVARRMRLVQAQVDEGTVLMQLAAR